MTHPSPRFRTLAQLATFASCLCLGLAFACGNTTENDDPGGDTTSGSTTNAGPTNGGNTTGGTTTGGGGTTGSDCPLLEPAQGSGCSTDARVCVYPNCTAPDNRDYHELVCTAGAWTLTRATACPLVSCPILPPVVGEGCDVSRTPGPCSAIDACGAALEVVCSNGIWQTTGNQDEKLPATTGGGGGAPGAPAAPICPPYPPYPGQSCCPASVPESCDYSGTGTDGAAGASFIIIPPDTSGTAAGAQPPLVCAVCTDQLVWDSCLLE